MWRTAVTMKGGLERAAVYDFLVPVVIGSTPMLKL